MPATNYFNSDIVLNGTLSKPSGTSNEVFLTDGSVSNLKTIDGNSILGTGDISFSGNYIQNQTVSVQTGGFWVTDGGYSDTSFTAPTIYIGQPDTAQDMNITGNYTNNILYFLQDTNALDIAAGKARFLNISGSGTTNPPDSVLKLSRLGTVGVSYNESAEFRIGHGGPSYYGSKLELWINGGSNTNDVPDVHTMTWNYDGTTTTNSLKTKGIFTVGGSNGNIDGLDISSQIGTGELLVGWNRSGGDGETDFVSNRGLGSKGGFSFLDLDNSGNLGEIFKLNPYTIQFPSLAGATTRLVTTDTNGVLGTTSIPNVTNDMSFMASGLTGLDDVIPATLFPVSIPNNTVYHLQFRLLISSNSPSYETAAYNKAMIVKNIGGTVTVVGIEDLFTPIKSSGMGSLIIGSTISGTDVLIQAYGNSQVVSFRASIEAIQI